MISITVTKILFISLIEKNNANLLNLKFLSQLSNIEIYEKQTLNKDN